MDRTLTLSLPSDRPLSHTDTQADPGFPTGEGGDGARSGEPPFKPERRQFWTVQRIGSHFNTNVYARAPAHTHAHLHKRRHTHAYARQYTSSHKTHTHTCTHTSTHINTNARTITHACTDRYGHYIKNGRQRALRQERGVEVKRNAHVPTSLETTLREPIHQVHHSTSLNYV